MRVTLLRFIFVYLRGPPVGEEEFCSLGRVTKGTVCHGLLRFFFRAGRGSACRFACRPGWEHVGCGLVVSSCAAAVCRGSRTCRFACRPGGHVGRKTCWLPYGILVPPQFLFSFSGVCVCGSYGTGVAGKFAGAMPSWDWMHEVDWQMLGGVCAGNSGEVPLPLVIAQVIRSDVSLEKRVISPRRHGKHRTRKW